MDGAELDCTATWAGGFLPEPEPCGTSRIDDATIGFAVPAVDAGGPESHGVSPAMLPSAYPACYQPAAASAAQPGPAALPCHLGALTVPPESGTAGVSKEEPWHETGEFWWKVFLDDWEMYPKIGHWEKMIMILYYHATERLWSIGSRTHVFIWKRPWSNLIMVAWMSSWSVQRPLVRQPDRQTVGLHYFSKSRENCFSIVELHDKFIHGLFQCESLSLTRRSASRQWSTFIIGLAHKYIFMGESNDENWSLTRRGASSQWRTFTLEEHMNTFIMQLNNWFFFSLDLLK